VRYGRSSGRDLHAVPWPVRRTPARWDAFYDFAPSLNALQDTFYAAHKIIGGVYYRLCYGAIDNTLSSARSIASAAVRRLTNCGR
jgi:hypothetical protein